jgi:peptidoglycan hydrolase-like protein with peptidoglycan-binding domain
MQASTQATTSLPACSVLPILRRNDQQASPIEYVRLLQKRLNTFHAINVNVDGFFGAKTEAAVKEYQERINDHDLSFVVDGIVGPKTWEALGLCVKG